MKKLTGILLTGLLVVMCGAWACEISTANLSALTTSKDKDGKISGTSFKGGETMYARAVVSNAMSKTKVKYQLMADAVEGMTKGQAIPGTDTTIDIPSGGDAVLTMPIPPGVKKGTYTLTADMLNESGEKKDSKSVSLTLEPSAPAAPPAAADDKDDKDADHEK